MAGRTAAGELTSRVEFAEATETDDAEIRKLLRENPMEGSVVLSLQTEPDYFTESRHFTGRQRTIIARENDRVVCLGSCAVRERFIDGTPRTVGYLKSLRLDARVAGRFEILRGGYRFFQEVERTNPAEIYFTSVASENARAIRFLERGLPGMPRYTFVSDYVTLLIPVPRFSNTKHSVSATCEDTGELIDFLNHYGREYQFAPVWTTNELQSLHHLGLQKDDVIIIRDGNEIVGCAALWDQRRHRQAVIHRYGSPLKYLRPAINAAAWLAGYPGLPATNFPMPSAFVSHLAGDVPLDQMLPALFALARQKNIQFLTAGFSAADPRVKALRSRFGARTYRSRLYVVSWADADAGISPGRRLFFPEVSLL